MQKNLNVKSFDGVELNTTIDTPSDVKAVIVIVHGLCEHQGRYERLVKKLTDHCYKVYRFDQRGHGKSGGERYFYSTKDEIIDDCNAIVDFAKSENPNHKIYVIGHSMGGFAVAAFGTKYPDKVDGIVISGGLTRDNNQMLSQVGPEIPPETQIPNELGDGVCSNPDVVSAYVADPLNGKFFTAGLAQQIAAGIQWLTENPTFNYPVLLIHGERDALVNPQDSRDFFAQIPSTDRQIKIYGGACHEVFNEYIQDEVMSDVIHWIDYRL
jgi:alpha-beta hydrolase superfamily lysophospholipase